MIVVPDAGPLIYLAGAGQLELLRRLYVEVVVPRIVFEEVTIAGAGLTGAAEVAAASWLQVVDHDADPALSARLDPGEAAAIPLALELGAVLLVDDGEARMVATEFGLSVIGSLGVLLAAKRAGYLGELGPVLDRMVTLGMFVGPALRARILVLAGEGTAGSR
jgi:predicted nucleic acid-binding protein